MRIHNFGHNVTWEPGSSYQPSTEQEVLDILDRHAGQKVRAVGSLHSWSDVARCPEVTLDLSRFDQVVVGRDSVTAGAGCRLQRLLDEVHARSELTLPALGAVKQQTIAGAVSTGTHGSGRPSLSHFVRELRLAAYDEDGKARVFTVSSGDELRAARCGLGCTGVVLSLTLECVPRYLVEEVLSVHDSLEEVLRHEAEWPLQQFILIPHSWRYVNWKRRPVSWRRLVGPSWLKARAYRLYNYLNVDHLLHLVVKALATTPWLGARLTPAFFKIFHKLVMVERRITDTSEAILTLEHHLYRHEEMELFVPARNLPKADRVVREATAVFARRGTRLSAELEEELRQAGLLGTLLAQSGRHVHHYPVVYRRILPEDTMISMASGREPYYSISFFTYANRRESFYAYAAWMARCLGRLVQARPHWGKHFPLERDEIAPLYPELEGFLAQCRKRDPAAVFTNDYTRRVLGYP